MPIVSVKSSNNCVKVYKIGKEGESRLLSANKTGKSKITVKFKNKSGKTVTKTTTVYVKKYPIFMKQLKFNGKKINLKKHKSYLERYNCKSNNVKIDLNLKKGWKIIEVGGYYIDEQTAKASDAKITKAMVLKGKSISFPKKYEYMGVYLSVKKGNTVVPYAFSISRNSNSF
jgi:hypothetical protein